jgi:adenine-specific DNA-methyltransferase
MGSKHRLLPWIAEHLAGLTFDTALDAFSGSGCVSYLLKCLGKEVTANDALLFAQRLVEASVENSKRRLDAGTLRRLLAPGAARAEGFIAQNFGGIIFELEDLRFLDRVWERLDGTRSEATRALAIAALIRSAMKRQPRGVFTVAGDPSRYKDGRRDLRLTLEEHFLESVQVFNELVFDSGRRHQALCGDVFEVPGSFDLVYLDPPYVPRSDDNCYVKRYHFLEGLASRWRAPGTTILSSSKVRKIPKRFTPFAYRKTSLDAFARLFDKFRESIIVLSYSSNGYPDRDVLVELLERRKRRVRVAERPHRYHFGTHARVAAARSLVQEYLIVAE